MKSTSSLNVFGLQIVHVQVLVHLLFWNVHATPENAALDP
jgi:hypothetical protein